MGSIQRRAAAVNPLAAAVTVLCTRHGYHELRGGGRGGAGTEQGGGGGGSTKVAWVQIVDPSLVVRGGWCVDDHEPLSSSSVCFAPLTFHQHFTPLPSPGAPLATAAFFTPHAEQHVIPPTHTPTHPHTHLHVYGPLSSPTNHHIPLLPTLGQAHD